MKSLRPTLICLAALALTVVSVLPAQAEVMSCFVDTPAFDVKTDNFCFAVGTARTTSACFQVNGVTDPSTSTISWSASGCSGFGFCLVPIRQYQTVVVSATVTDALGNSTTVSATARYEGFF